MARLNRDQLDPRNNLQYYTRAALQNSEWWDDKAIRAEYSRLRDIAQKRLKRLAELEPESYAYKYNRGKYAPARGQSTAELRAQLPELAKFIAAKTGSVTGIRAQRRKAVATLQSRGYTGITEKNIKAFGEFMDEWRASKESHSIGSPTAASFFEWSQEHEIPWERIKEDFARWLKRRKDLEKYVQKRSNKGEEVTADDIIAEFDRLEQKRIEYNRRRREKRKAARAADNDTD